MTSVLEHLRNRETINVYLASKTAHAWRWKDLRGHWARSRITIYSSWINEAGPGESKSMRNLWYRCVNEACFADVLIAYREKDEELKGALVEIGAALAHDVPVFLVGDWPKEKFSFLHHPHVFIGYDIAMVGAMLGYTKDA